MSKGKKRDLSLHTKEMYGGKEGKREKGKSNRKPWMPKKFIHPS